MGSGTRCHAEHKQAIVNQLNAFVLQLAQFRLQAMGTARATLPAKKSGVLRTGMRPLICFSYCLSVCSPPSIHLAYQLRHPPVINTDNSLNKYNNFLFDMNVSASFIFRSSKVVDFLMSHIVRCPDDVGTIPVIISTMTLLPGVHTMPQHYES